MCNETRNFFDYLSDVEAEFMRSVIQDLRQDEWAQDLLTYVERNGGLTRTNKSQFFELRFGYSLREIGITPQYEVPGINQSTVDFGFVSAGQRWLVELMRLEETDAAQGATGTEIDGDGIPWVHRALTTNADDPRRSEEGETLKAIERICQKCEHDGRPHKFPKPDDAFHMILVDMRTFLNGGDRHDYVHIGLGGESISEEPFRRYWKGKLIAGVFSNQNQLRGAEAARDRVHLIGFVNEREYRAGEFGNSIRFVHNPKLLTSWEAVKSAVDKWPLTPAGLD